MMIHRILNSIRYSLSLDSSVPNWAGIMKNICVWRWHGPVLMPN